MSTTRNTDALMRVVEAARKVVDQRQRALQHGRETASMVDLQKAIRALDAAAEPEATQASALEAMRTRLADGTVRRHAEEAARKAEPEAKAPAGRCPACSGIVGAAAHDRRPVCQCSLGGGR